MSAWRPAASCMRGGRGQAALEVVALLPLLVGLALLAVQVAAVLGAVSEAQDRARSRALQATGRPGEVVTVHGSARPPALAALGPRGDAVRVRVAVRLP
ncbi:MAG: hypothetical protein ACO3PB_09480 [Miltoncostaeaceae bacterium]